MSHKGLTLRLRDVALAAGDARGRVLIERLSMEVLPGQRWVLLGPNGAGKSTLLAALAGLLQPLRGSIELGATSLDAWDALTLAKQRAWCPQFWLDPFAATAQETVAYAVCATQNPHTAGDVAVIARNALRRLDAESFSQRDVRTLSGGERQRVALATAFAQNAPLLLLDEPTSHLDWSHQALLQSELVAWSNAGGAVVAAVHDFNLAWALATHVLLLDGRGTVMQGCREDLLQAPILSAVFGQSVSIRDEDGIRWFRVDLDARTQPS